MRRQDVAISVAPPPALQDGTLWLDDRAALHGVPAGWSTVTDASATGVFLHGAIAAAAYYWEMPLGQIAGLRRFTSVARARPFWVHPVTGTSENAIQPETQWLLGETTAGLFIFIVPLLDGSCRFALQGSEAGLVVVGETGDPAVVARGGVAVFVAVGTEPYALMAAAARAVGRHHGTGALRSEKPLPDFVDWFGWCTWDAFYHDVSPEKIRAGLASFAAGGVEPRVLILDDGWQSVRRGASGEDRIVSFAANDRFAGDLAPIVRVAKGEFAVERFLVWHALIGYWGGVCAAALPDYDTRTVARAFGPGILRGEPHANVRPWGAVVGVPAATQIARFFDDYHRTLRVQGVDGVKVDNQATLEAVSAGQGGRVALARVYRQALEESVARHFGGRMINCMSCTPECVYLAAPSTVMRTSDDFWPERPESHGTHIYTNAHASLWFGEFMHPDWDMFQSAHAMGAFHAAARAVSGGPVYVSDRPEEHDFALLRKLTLSDGTILRADAPGRLTRDCLFIDPTKAPVLLKIFNTNGDCGVVGIFNARGPSTAAAREMVSGEVSPRDVPALAKTDFIGHAQRSGELWRCDAGAAGGSGRPVSLSAGEWEIVTFAPVKNGFAAIGLADKLNSAGAIAAWDWPTTHECRVELRDGGKFIAWAARAPSVIECDVVPITFAHEATSGRLGVNVPAGGRRVLVLRWA